MKKTAKAELASYAGILSTEAQRRGRQRGGGGADSGQDGAPAGLLGAHMTSGLLAVVTST